MSRGGGSRSQCLLDKAVMMDGDVFRESTTLLKSAKAFGNAIIAIDRMAPTLPFLREDMGRWGKRVLPRDGVLAKFRLFVLVPA